MAWGGANVNWGGLFGNAVFSIGRDPRVREFLASNSAHIKTPLGAGVSRQNPVDQHHIFTQSRRRWFEARYGIDVDDFVVDVSPELHRVLHAGRRVLDTRAGWWDAELMSRIRLAEALSPTGKISRSQVLDIGEALVRRFGLDGLPRHALIK